VGLRVGIPGIARRRAPGAVGEVGTVGAVAPAVTVTEINVQE
jgi:hypothetical protein